MWLRLNPNPAAFFTCRLLPLPAAKISRKIRTTPPAAAVAMIQYSHDTRDESLHHLHSPVQLLKSWEPAEETAERLKWVDTLQRLGVDRYTQPEIDVVLRDVFRSWQQKEEGIFGDPTCLAMAFRILRMKGYNVKPGNLDALALYTDAKNVEISTVLELYRASQVRVYEDESILERINDWTTKFLKQELQSNNILDKKLKEQVEFELKNFHGILDRVGHRRNIELYVPDENQYPAMHNEDLLLFSRQDFNFCQAQHQKELDLLERWYYVDSKLDSMDYGRNVLPVGHFLASALMADPEQAHSRAAFAKHTALITRLDDFFDYHGSREDSLEITDLMKEWKQPSSLTYSNEEVEILYTAVYNTLTELAEIAYPIQGRDITNVLTHLWVEILTSFVREMDSITDENAPTMEEYMSFAWVSTGCRLCILVLLQLLGVKLPEEVIFSSECTDLCRHASSIFRLLNDIQSFEREKQERKLNSVSLQLLADKGAITEEEASSKVFKMVEYHRRELLRLVLETEGSIIPKDCKNFFWMFGKVGYYLFSSTDEVTSPQQMKEDIKSLIYEPL